MRWIHPTYAPLHTSWIIRTIIDESEISTLTPTALFNQITQPLPYISVWPQPGVRVRVVRRSGGAGHPGGRRPAAEPDPARPRADHALRRRHERRHAQPRRSPVPLQGGTSTTVEYKARLRGSSQVVWIWGEKIAILAFKKLTEHIFFSQFHTSPIV